MTPSPAGKLAAPQSGAEHAMPNGHIGACPSGTSVPDPGPEWLLLQSSDRSTAPADAADVKIEGSIRLSAIA